MKKIFREKSFVKGTIAQAIICVLLLPFTACLIRMFNLNIGDMAVNLINKIFVMEVWFDLLVDFSNIRDVFAELEEFTNQNLKKWSFMMYEVWVIALISEIVKDVSRRIGLKGLPIFPAVVTVFVYAFVQKITDINFIYMLVELLILIVIYLCIKFFVSKISFFVTIFTGFFKLYIDSCIALSTTAYIATLALIINGKLNGFADILVVVGMTMMALLLSLFVDFLLSGLIDKK